MQAAATAQMIQTSTDTGVLAALRETAHFTRGAWGIPGTRATIRMHWLVAGSGGGGGGGNKGLMAAGKL